MEKSVVDSVNPTQVRTTCGLDCGLVLGCVVALGPEYGRLGLRGNALGLVWDHACSVLLPLEACLNYGVNPTQVGTVHMKLRMGRF